MYLSGFDKRGSYEPVQYAGCETCCNKQARRERIFALDSRKHHLLPHEALLGSAASTVQSLSPSSLEGMCCKSIRQSGIFIREELGSSGRILSYTDIHAAACLGSWRSIIATARFSLCPFVKQRSFAVCRDVCGRGFKFKAGARWQQRCS